MTQNDPAVALGVVLARLGTLATQCALFADDNENLGDGARELGDDVGMGRAYGARDAHRAIARRLYEIIGDAA